MKYGELKYPISDYINNKLEKIHSYTFIDIKYLVGFTSIDVFIKNSNIKFKLLILKTINFYVLRKYFKFSKISCYSKFFFHITN